MSASLWTWTNLWQNPGKKPCDAGLSPLFLTERGGACYTNSWFPLPAAVAKQADARDLKSLGLLTVPVRSRSAAPRRSKVHFAPAYFLPFAENKPSIRSLVPPYMRNVPSRRDSTLINQFRPKSWLSRTRQGPGANARSDLLPCLGLLAAPN